MSLAIDFERLSTLGFNAVLASRALQAAADASPGAALFRVIEVSRETLLLHDGSAARRARSLPRLIRALLAEGDALAVGDWVLASVDVHGELWVEMRIPPATHIVRRDGDGLRHAVVSNVDTALLVMGLDADFNPRRIERYLALVHGEGILAVVVLTKRDLAEASAVPPEARCDELRRRVPAGTGIVAVDGTHPDAASALAPWLGRGQTLVLLGSSGAGKSTLTNTLLGRAVQDTGAIREHDGRGKHTTTSRSLHLLSGGACVIDTPGLRALSPDAGVAVSGAFADIEALAPLCRFRDCRHEQEPGCAVRTGVDADRLRNYHKLLREVKRETATPLDRQREVALWKSRGRAAAARMKAKRGA